MSARVLEGEPIAERLKGQLRERLAKLGPPAPKLVALMVGENPGAVAYAKQQARACEELDIAFELRQFAETITEAELLGVVEQLNADATVTGIIIQMPLPEHIDRRRAQRAVNPLKDVDGVHPANLGATVQGRTTLAPCTAQAVVTLVEEAGVPVEGAELVMVGHSEIVGKPTALLLLDRFATTTVCHIATRDLAFHTRRADILIVAVGKPGLIRGDMIKPGALVIDVGINRIKDPATGKTRLVGDVAFEEALEVAGIITPVPGGVGPLTVVMLLKNIVEAAELQRGLA
jgi:methylenetetrahydrofolate dehydrogenase (NADP+)/methenyltetrahydrofolate cyclohydrolase